MAKRKSEYSLEVVKVTPNMAIKMLENNAHYNRPISQRWVMELASVMKEGGWRVNGECIVLNELGQLIDGQHRLWAVIEANIPVKMSIFRGVESDYHIYETHGQGKRRKASDYIPRNGNILQATYNLIMRIRDKKLRDRAASMTTKNVMDFHRKHDLTDLVQRIHTVTKKYGYLITPSQASAFYYLFSQKNQAQADEFMTKLLTGYEIKENDVIALLRLRIIKNKAARIKLPQYIMFALIIRAWNVFREGKTIKRLVWDKKEPFPKIK